MPIQRRLDLRALRLLGVLNLTPDSFSDGGRFFRGSRFDEKRAFAVALRMVEHGADALDLGAESTRPGAKPVAAKIQIQRLVPLIKLLRRERALKPIPLSVDTQSAAVAEACLEVGADLVNDVSALRHDSAMAGVVGRARCPVILMHMQGEPGSMQKNPRYKNVVREIIQFFEVRIRFSEAAGITKKNILLDPGIGFGKTLEHNLEILRNLKAFTKLGCPLVLGVSRKRFLGALTGETDPAQRVMASVAAGLFAVDHGVRLLRVHDVKEHAQALRVWQAL